MKTIDLRTLSERVVSLLLENVLTIQGEYWIINGDIAFADGDVGDVNHEAYATDHARRTLLDHFGGDSDGEVITDEELSQAAAEELTEVGIPFNPDDWYPAAKRLLSEQPNSEAMIATLQCALGMGDAREIAMKYWGWKWCRKNNIATWTFTADDRRSIVSGLNEIISQEMDDEENWDELEITIGVGATGKRYSMTLAELESGRSVSRDPTWGGMGESDEKSRSMRYMEPEIERIATVRKLMPDEEVSNATFDTVDLCRRSLDKLKEINYYRWQQFVSENSEYVELLNGIVMARSSGEDYEGDTAEAHEALDSFWEVISNELNRHCPQGYGFGSHAGNGSLMGCWKEDGAY